MDKILLSNGRTVSSAFSYQFWPSGLDPAALRFETCWLHSSHTDGGIDTSFISGLIFVCCIPVELYGSHSMRIMQLQHFQLRIFFISYSNNANISDVRNYDMVATMTTLKCRAPKCCSEIIFFWAWYNVGRSQWALSKAWTVFSRSNAGIVVSNPTQGMDVCLRLFCVYVGSGLATCWSLVQGVLPTV
jgi:hypothetical protein